MSMTLQCINLETSKAVTVKTPESEKNSVLKFLKKAFENLFSDYIWLSEHGKIYTSYFVNQTVNIRC